MRKIISILIALGLILGLVVIATPVAAKVIGPAIGQPPQVDLSTYCACENAAYNITFNVSASLTEGVHCVKIKFPAGTTVPTSYKDGDILIGKLGGTAYSVFASEVTVSGTTVSFLVPVHFTTADNPLLVQFLKKADIANPCTPGKYKLEIATCREPDSEFVLSEPYYIKPCVSSYGFAWDSSPTYPGIADDFVPPFKACGQANNATIGIEGAVAHPTLANAYMNAFNLTFGPEVVGCLPPCAKVDFYLSLVASPQFSCAAVVDPVAKVTINFTGPSTLNTTTLYWDECTMDEPAVIPLATGLTLDVATVYSWAGLIHFDTVGEYTICFWAECPGGAGGVCTPGTGEELIAERCFDFEVHQWKDAGKIILDEKWNLISLPLVPFDTDIDVLLGSLSSEAKDGDGNADLVSIWHFDQCTDVWAVYGNGQSSLTDMVDGKSYWVRMTYPMPLPGATPAVNNYTWWVWGTARAMPPAAPSAYTMCAGWNMFGFTSLGPKTLSAYLWNFTTLPLVYGWNNNGDWLTSGWSMKVGASGLVSGQGYWGAFPSTGGTIIP